MNRLRLRRRLTIAFLLIAAFAATAVAVSSYLLVRQAWLADSLQRAEADARFQLTLAADLQPVDAEGIQDLLESFIQTHRDVVLVADGVSRASNPAINPVLPESLRATVASGQLGFQRMDGLLVLGGRIAGTSAELYVIYVEEPIYSNLEQLRNVLLGGALGVTVVAGAIGYALARRTLQPVGRAAAAAQAVAAGRLDTRLPAGRDEFGAWAASFNQMADALQAKLAALSAAEERERRFTANVAHELRTPVTALVAEASLLREQLDQLPTEARRPAELLVGDVVRLRRLVDELMEISRLDAGEERVREEEVDLAALVSAVVAAGEWSDRVRVDVAPTVVRTDRRRVERVLTNLIANAIHHAGTGVEVRLGRTRSSVWLEVADDGPGIAPEHLPHLFDRFYKVDPARSMAGSGLGLAIARENARLLGGTLSVGSWPGVGTTFRLGLPVTQLLRDGETAVVEAADGGEAKGAPS
jgi:signal transduction histidine kinase